MTKTVIVDSDAIYALYNPNDPLNAKATQTFQKLIDEGVKIIYPTSVIFEIISLFQRVLLTPKITTMFQEKIVKEQLLIYEIDSEILKAAAELFKPAGSKKNTLIDCSVVAIAKQVKADAVFSYDEFYSKQGLKLVEELTK